MDEAAAEKYGNRLEEQDRDRTGPSPRSSSLEVSAFSQHALADTPDEVERQLGSGLDQGSLSQSMSAEETIRRRNQVPPSGMQQKQNSGVTSVFDVFEEMREEKKGSSGEDALPRIATSSDLESAEKSSEAHPAPPLARPPPIQGRGVSWGLNSNFMLSSSSGSILSGPIPQEQVPTAHHDRQKSTSSGLSSLSIGQPELSNVPDTHSKGTASGTGLGRPPPISYRGTSAAHQQLQRRRSLMMKNNLSSRVHLMVDDLTDYNPVEAEAETYLIRALEHREPSSRHPVEESPVVFSNLNDEAAASLMTSHERQNTLGTLSDESPLPPQPPARPGGPSKAVLNRGKSNARTPSHRRGLTMEQKLFGLASAIDAMNVQQQTAVSPPDGTTSSHPDIPAVSSELTGRQRSNTLGSAIDAPEHTGTGGVDHAASPKASTVDGLGPSAVSPPASSADAFQQNASILYKRLNKKNQDTTTSSSSGGVIVGVPSDLDRPLHHDDSAHTKGAASSSHHSVSQWEKLKAAVRMSPTHPKKSDDIIGETGDEPQDVEAATGTEALESNQPGCEGQDETGGGSGGYPGRVESMRASSFLRPLQIVDEWKFARDFKVFLLPWAKSIRFFLKVLLLLVMLPATGIAVILFYLAGNPPTGILIPGQPPVNGMFNNTNGILVSEYSASASWWLLFVCVRQAITLSLAVLTELVIVDYLSIHTGVTFSVLGAWPTLFILQSRGWPFVAFVWGVLDFILLAGSKPFFAHWLYWQSVIDLFNTANPSGHVVDSSWNHRVLSIVVCVSFVTSVKRFFMGFYLGKNTFRIFSEKLASVMKKILLISQVAALSRDVEDKARVRARSRQQTHVSTVLTQDKLGDLLQNADDVSTSTNPKGDPSIVPSLGLNASSTEAVIDPEDRHPLTGALSQSQRNRIVQLLGAWEEPSIASQTNEPVSVNALLQFRRALTCLNTDFPFSASFGPAGTREDAIESSQNVFCSLLKESPDSDFLNFDSLATLGVLPDGSLDQQKLIDLIKLFRPNRDGSLSMIDFVKSTDSVYREIRLLRAAVNNSSKIDAAFENIFNVFFYGIVVIIVLSQLGFDPLAMFLSISGVVLAFAFMIGPASSKYFEGLLFILVRRPYDIGDGIHVSDINQDTAPMGSGWWLVEDVTLFTTTVMFMFTNERATLANGSLASSRIINATRSHHACVCNYIKLPLDVPYEKLQLFNEAIEQYVHNRPREWRALCSIRAIKIETAQGFVEYSIVLEHRESWKSWAALRNSQAQLATFTIELCKKLEIWYKNPPVPVNLSFVNTPSNGGNLTMGPIGVPIERGHRYQESGLSSNVVNSLSPGDNLEYSPDLRSLQAKFMPANDPAY